MPSGLGHELRAAKGWGGLPARMRLLYITTARHAQGWLAEAFAADSACRVDLVEVIGRTAGMSRLREESFDAVLATYQPEELDALDLVEAMRTGGCEDPVVVLGPAGEQDLAVLCHEVGADGYCCIESTTTRSLLWTLARAIELRQLQRENRQLSHALQQRAAQEQQEADRLLSQQRGLVQELERLRQQANHPRQTNGGQGDTYGPPAPPLPETLAVRYRELLRTHVMMGSGALSREVHQFAEQLAAASVPAQQCLQLHVETLEALIQGLGQRSTRHVASRADLLILEVLLHLCESYRCKPADAPLHASPHFSSPTDDLRRDRGYA